MKTGQNFVCLVAITLAGTACGANIDRGEQEEVVNASQAVTSTTLPIAESSLSTLATPACVFGSDSVIVRNRARVDSDIGSNATVEIQAGDVTAKTAVNGNISARGNVRIGSNSAVGNINTPGTVTVEPGATTGTITHNAVPVVTLTTKTVTPGTLDINLNAPSCAGSNPAPGNYRYVNVNPGCTLTLRAGTYNVASMNISANAGLNVTGAVNLNANAGFTFGDYAVLTGVTDPTTFQIYSNTSVYIQTHTTFRGTILAPNGDASLGSSSNLTGCIRGKRTALDGVTTLQQNTCNPPLNSVWSSHGNEEPENLWIVDDAQAFLDGNDRNGNPVAAHFAPSTWTKGRFWLPLGSMTYAGKYFYDSTLDSTGIDTSISGGVDANQMLRFHEGHGNPDGFSALGDFVDEYRMKLGNCSNQGRLRYFWLTSCDVFAHGPQTCSGATLEYSCPEKFDGSPDSYAMRNVYQRWGNAVKGGYLRMACGGSTTMYGGVEHGDDIWYDYNDLHYDVADSFQQGVRVNSPTDPVIPICITTGGTDVTKTPLYDTTFTNQPNLGGNYYWIQFVNAFQTHAGAAAAIANYESLTTLPVLDVDDSPVGPADASAFDENATSYVSKQQVAGRGAQLTINKATGAMIYQGPRNVELTSRPESEYLSAAQAFIQQRNWNETDAAAPAGAKTMLERATVSGTPELRAQKNVFVAVKRQISIGGQTIPVLGAGGAILIQMNNDGTIANASKVWRTVKVGASMPLVPFAEAERRARSRVPANYALQSSVWGYKEEAGDVPQRQMRIVLQFRYAPVMTTLSGTAADEIGKTIEVAAQ